MPAPDELSEQQELFCQNLAKGLNQRDAYKAAGYKTTTDAATDANASRLLSNDKIAARMAQLHTRAEKRHDITLDRITQMLLEDRDLARKNTQSSAAVSATMGLAKIHGHVIDRAEIEDKTNYAVTNRPKTDEEWQTEFSPGQRPN